MSEKAAKSQPIHFGLRKALRSQVVNFVIDELVAQGEFVSNHYLLDPMRWIITVQNMNLAHGMSLWKAECFLKGEWFVIQMEVHAETQRCSYICWQGDKPIFKKSLKTERNKPAEYGVWS